MDDIIIFNRSWEDLVIHVQQVLQRLREAADSKLSKCQWVSASLIFLGHMVDIGQVSIPTCKVDAMKNHVHPVTTKKNVVQSFLGMAGYYRHFIPRCSYNSSKLTEVTQRSAPNIMWNYVLNDEFTYLCSFLCQLSSLTIPVPSDIFCLTHRHFSQSYSWYTVRDPG